MSKSSSRLSLTAMALVMLPLAACIDDNYDLSDIDTNVQFKVNNLTVPVNLDEITLSNIFDLDEGSVIKVVDGNYAVLVDGDFRSEAINVSAVNLPRPVIPSANATISLLSDGAAPGSISIPAINIGEKALTYSVAGVSTNYTYTTSNVDKSIRAISKVSVDWSIKIDLTVANTGNVFKSIALRDVALKIPAGLRTPGFNNRDGIISIDDINLSPGNMTHSLTLKVDEIDISRLSTDQYVFEPDPSGNGPGKLTVSGSIGIEGGYVVAITNDVITQIPTQSSLTLAPEGSEIDIKAIDGEILYEITGFNVAPVTLNDLPDLLREQETNITIANPRLYLSINNPLADYGLGASSGLTLTACRNASGQRDSYSLDPGQLVTIGHDKGIQGPYNFCLAPDPTAQGGLTDFASPAPVVYSQLGNVLGGNGLPDMIEVTFDNPHVGPGAVKGFKIPQTLQNIQGKYSFYAPLNLGVGSTVMYDGDETGWNDETVEKIVVEKLAVEADVFNGLPFDIELSGYPVDTEGKQCVDPTTGRKISLEASTVKAGTTSTLTISCEGIINGLDGIHYYARGIVRDGNVTLRPDAIIKLSGIKARISGHYTDEL